MIIVEAQGVTVEVAPETVRSKINKQIIHKKIYLSYIEIAEVLGYSAEDILQPIIDFGSLGPRVKITKGKIDFQFITHHDTVKEVEKKCNAYLDSDCLELTEAIINAANSLDTPHDPDLTAGALPESVEKKE